MEFARNALTGISGPLEHLLAQFSLKAGVFYTGNICGLHDFERDALRAHLHLVRRGPVKLIEPGKAMIVIDQPALIFLPRPEAHRLIADECNGADVVCATVSIEGGGHNPIFTSLPGTVLIELQRLQDIDKLLELIFGEAFEAHTGQQAILDRLCEVLVIRMLRHCLEQGLVEGGALAGLADPKLGKVLEAIHRKPSNEWDLPTMAAEAGMSRARFADRFQKVVGKPPGDYLASWRITLAQRLLTRGMASKVIAARVGYRDSSAMHRAFVGKLGIGPSEWLKRQANEPSPS